MLRFALEQAQCQVWKYIDVDRDGIGEFATGIELFRASPLRAGLVAGSIPPACSFERVSGWYPGLPVAGLTDRIEADGSLVKGGYRFTFFLPDGGTPSRWVRAGIAEGAISILGGTGNIGIDAAEKTWCVYATPLEWGASGRKMFFAGRRGEILECGNSGGIAGNREIDPTWAFTGTDVLSDHAIDRTGRNGEVWTVPK